MLRQKRYCPQGHDTYKVGRHASNGGCRECSRVQAAERYRKNPERYRARSRGYAREHPERQLRRLRETKLWAIVEKGGVCMDCGFDFLGEGRPECAQFDHAHGPRSWPQGRSMAERSREQVRKELVKCDLVCANCHFTRTRHRHEGSAVTVATGVGV